MYGHVMSPKKFSYLFVYIYGFKRKIVRVTRFVLGKGMVENIFILQKDILNRCVFQNGNLAYCLIALTSCVFPNGNLAYY